MSDQEYSDGEVSLGRNLERNKDSLVARVERPLRVISVAAYAFLTKNAELSRLFWEILRAVLPLWSRNPNEIKMETIPHK